MGRFAFTTEGLEEPPWHKEAHSVISFISVLQRLPSCGCFGAVPVQSRAMVDIDALMVLALLASSPVLESRPPSRGTRVRYTVGVLLVVTLLGVVGWQATRALQPAQAGTSAPNVLQESAVDPKVVARVIQGAERNYVDLHSLICTLHVTRTTFSSQSASSLDAAKKGEDGTEPKTQPRVERRNFKSILHGTDLRRDGETVLPDLDAREMRVETRGTHIQYLPGLKQAWLFGANPFAEKRMETIDLRCAGFPPPIQSIAEWLRKADVRNTRLLPHGNDGEIVRLHALAQNGKDDVTLDCLSTANYMPVRVIHRFTPGGSIFTINDLEYQKLDALPVWVPKTWKYRSFTRDVTTDADAATGFDLFTETYVRVLSVNGAVNDEVFDPLLPLHTRLVGNLAAQPSTGDEPVRASAVMRAEPLASPPPTPQEYSPWLWVLVAIDGATLGLCLVFRRELAW
jgi:hypothetical protein